VGPLADLAWVGLVAFVVGAGSRVKEGVGHLGLVAPWCVCTSRRLKVFR